MEIYHHSTYSSSDCSAQDPGLLSYTEIVPINSFQNLILSNRKLYDYLLELGMSNLTKRRTRKEGFANCYRCVTAYLTLFRNGPIYLNIVIPLRNKFGLCFLIAKMMFYIN